MKHVEVVESNRVVLCGLDIWMPVPYVKVICTEDGFEQIGSRTLVWYRQANETCWEYHTVNGVYTGAVPWHKDGLKTQLFKYERCPYAPQYGFKIGIDMWYECSGGADDAFDAFDATWFSYKALVDCDKFPTELTYIIEQYLGTTVLYTDPLGLRTCLTCGSELLEVTETTISTTSNVIYTAPDGWVTSPSTWSPEPNLLNINFTNSESVQLDIVTGKTKRIAATHDDMKTDIYQMAMPSTGMCEFYPDGGYIHVKNGEPVFKWCGKRYRVCPGLKNPHTVVFAENHSGLRMCLINCDDGLFYSVYDGDTDIIAVLHTVIHCKTTGIESFNRSGFVLRPYGIVRFNYEHYIDLLEVRSRRMYA